MRCLCSGGMRAVRFITQRTERSEHGQRSSQDWTVPALDQQDACRRAAHSITLWCSLSCQAEISTCFCGSRSLTRTVSVSVFTAALTDEMFSQSRRPNLWRASTNTATCCLFEKSSFLLFFQHIQNTSESADVSVSAAVSRRQTTSRSSASFSSGRALEKPDKS